MLLSACALAIPAVPHPVTVTQPDGTTVECYLRGDENFSYYETLDGHIALRGDDGLVSYATLSGGRLAPSGLSIARPAAAPLRADSPAVRAALDDSFRQGAKARQRIAPGEINNKFKTTGTVPGIIILVEFQDVKMSEKGTAETFNDILNKENFSTGKYTGSVRDYFIDQSNGKFTPEFDVVGPVLLPREMAYYGGGGSNHGDMNGDDYVALMGDAMHGAQEQYGVDFSKYDSDDNGFIDFVFLICAGYGQAQGGPYESMWPAKFDFSYYLFDDFNGKNVAEAAWSCELHGNSGDELDGIGTICHEFSHILGLPDVYDARYQGGYGMAHYDIMDYGAYNGDTFLPASMTAMDRYYVGWLTPEVLETPAADLSLGHILTSNEAYFIVNPNNPDEYFTLENRQWNKWDAGLPGHGLVVSAISYNPSYWRSNTVNSPSMNDGYCHIQIVAADNTLVQNGTPFEPGSGSEAGDTFPGTSGVTAFSATTTPAAIWRSTPRAATPDFAITDIREEADGTVRFNFNTTAGIDGIASDETLSYDAASLTLSAPGLIEVFTLDGVKAASADGSLCIARLPKGLYIARSADSSVKIRR